MDLKFSKKINRGNNIKSTKKPFALKEFDVRKAVRSAIRPDHSDQNRSKGYFFVFAIFFGIFGILLWQLSSLQIAQGSDFAKQSEENQIKVDSITADRGVIFDRNGVKLVENVSSSKLYISIDKYLDEKGDLETDKLNVTTSALSSILGEHWTKTSTDGKVDYTSILDRIEKIHEESTYFRDILLASDLSNEEVIKVKAASDNLMGIYIDEGSKRSYPFKNVISEILGYTGEVTADDLKNLDYVNATDIVGRTGLEREYDELLAGTDGEMAWEVDRFEKKLSDKGLILTSPVAGDDLYLSIDMDVQNELYSALENGIKKAKATGGAGVIEDVTTGEIIAMVTYPSYDDNLFIGGISYSDYSKLLNDTSNPLMNRAIAAQVPPGSTFKTLVATGALDSGAITTKTYYTSTSNYTFSNGASFQEYHNHAYGTVNVLDALMVSSNIFFCETIRHWNIEALDVYLDNFGIGKVTGIDLPGEMSGRLPSPANKIALANSTSPWLDPIWYPEGDSCNSVIGQGITLVTPLQMSNWMAAIANGGTLYQPHLAKYYVDAQGKKTEVGNTVVKTNLAKQSSLDIVKDGMREAVVGSRASVSQLANVGIEVAAKTGTAEFGAVDKDGNYEHTHAWVGGFFPYDSPKYSFSIFLEDGGESYNATNVMKEVITWMVQNKKI